MKLHLPPRRFGPGDYAPYLLLAALIGAVPAASIRLRGDLIDAAVGGAGGDTGFWPLLAAVLALSLFNGLGAAVMGRLGERRRIRQGARLDAARLEKAARTAFPVTETQRFHTLWDSSAEAPELDAQIFRSLGDALRLSVKLALSLLVLWSMDAWTAVGVLLLLTAGILLNMALARRTDGFWVRYRENMRRVNYLSSLLTQREYAAERKLFSFDGEIDRRYRDSFARAKRENAKLGRGRFQIEAAMQVLFAVYAVSVALLLLRPLLRGAVTVGLYTSAFYAAVELEQGCRQMCAAVYDLIGAARKLKGYSDFLALPEDAPAEGDDVGDELRTIELRDVTFTYPGAERPVLEHLSFRLEPGRHYALVGENGCGKSTLVKLLVGLYRPDSGEVLVNGKPVSSLSPGDRRRLFCVVFQDLYRYPLTVRENVSLGMDAPAEDAALDTVFGKLDLHPAAVKGDAGYDSDLMPLYKTGAGLSGGEWQKLAVARSVLSRAPMAILDEPNAALDPMAEAKIYAAYRGLLARRTTLFISHRLGSVRMSDEILVIKDGALLAMAPHGALMRECAYYAELFNTQKGLYDEQEEQDAQ